MVRPFRPEAAEEKGLILADTSAIIQFTRVRGGRELTALAAGLQIGELAVTRLTVLETLQGARDERNWRTLDNFLSDLQIVELLPEDWKAAARIVTDLRRRGLTVSDPIDCCIAQAALSRGIPLLHRDRDFESIRAVRKSLSLIWLG